MGRVWRSGASTWHRIYLSMPTWLVQIAFQLFRGFEGFVPIRSKVQDVQNSLKQVSTTLHGVTS
jgi:hypothetical protein